MSAAKSTHLFLRLALSHLLRRQLWLRRRHSSGGLLPLL